MATYAKYADMYKNRTRSQDVRVSFFFYNVIYHPYFIVRKLNELINDDITK